MLDSICYNYTPPRRGVVIYPGRNPIFFNPYVSKDDSVLSVGRLVDAGKQVFLLTQHSQPFRFALSVPSKPCRCRAFLSVLM